MAARPLPRSKPFPKHRSSWPATARMTPLPRRFHRPAPVAPLPRERHRHRSLKRPSSKEVIKESAHARSPHNLPEVLFPAVLVRRCIPKRTAGENLCDDDKKPVCSRPHGKKYRRGLPPFILASNGIKSYSTMFLGGMSALGHPGSQYHGISRLQMQQTKRSDSLSLSLGR